MKREGLIPLDVIRDSIRIAAEQDPLGEAKVHRSYLAQVLALVARGQVEIVREEPTCTVVRLARRVA